ncbi:transposase [uncultured Desulfobulbus sp.]|uniref:helix-turn-helix domain-containing protein n=1 Tax=uncultured Desulfobulbus sp. TaxID=239745 RepID=UPI00374D1DC5
MPRTHENYTIIEDEQRSLEALLRSPKTAQSLVFRAEIILLTASGKTVEQVASQLGTTALTVYRWRKRFKDQGLTGLQDRFRSGQPKKAEVTGLWMQPNGVHGGMNATPSTLLAVGMRSCHC